MEYIPKKREISDNRYQLTLRFIRTRKELLSEKARILSESVSPEKPSRLSEVDRQLSAIDDSLMMVPQEYRSAVIGWVLHPKMTGVGAVRIYQPPCTASALSYWRTKYVQEVAYRAGFIGGEG